MMKKLFAVLAAVFFVLGMFGVAQANLITGNLWKVPEATASWAIPANVPGTLADVTFDVNSPLNFAATDATVGTWLGSGSAFNILENTPGTLVSLMDNFVTGTLVEFTGFVTVSTGQSFSVIHDDGLTLIIGGVDMGFNPGPTPPVLSTATWMGASGNYPFQLVYGEVSRGPAVLQVDLPFSNNPVPEPTTMLLLGTGLVGVAGAARRKKKNQA